MRKFGKTELSTKPPNYYNLDIFFLLVIELILKEVLSLEDGLLPY